MYRFIDILAIKCPEGMIYNHEMQPCQKMCDNLANCTNVGSPIAGCECENPLHVLDGEKCIQPDHCGCIYQGRYLSVCVYLLII